MSPGARFLLTLASIPVTVLAAFVSALALLMAITLTYRVFGSAGWLPTEFQAGFVFGLVLFPCGTLIDRLLSRIAA